MSRDDGFPEAEDSPSPQYEPPTVFDMGNVVAVTHGNGNGPDDSNLGEN